MMTGHALSIRVRLSARSGRERDGSGRAMVGLPLLCLFVWLFARLGCARKMPPHAVQ